MIWIIFDEADHYSPAPYFCLLSSSGRQVCLHDYHEACNLVLVFTHGLACTACREGLEEFSERTAEYLALEARILAVVPDPVEAVQRGERSLEVSFPLLSDAHRIARSLYAALMDASLVKDEDTLIFVLDRYSAPYAAWIGKDFSDPSIHKEIHGWLAFIGIQCPE